MLREGMTKAAQEQASPSAVQARQPCPTCSSRAIRDSKDRAEPREGQRKRVATCRR